MRAILATASVLAIALIVGTEASGARARPTMSLNESGSTLLYPLFKIWIADYRKTAPDVRMTAAGTGSGAGVAGAVAGADRIGASDAYMSDEEVDAHPAIINVPLAISAQTVDYNLPGLNHAHLKLSGPAIAGIYSGAITQWDAREIADLNPGARLPHHAIVPIRRSDGSGDTFMFTQFLTFSTPAWENAVNYGTAVTWPSAPGAIDVAGNPAMIAAARTHPYSIAYIGNSFAKDVAAAGLGTAALQNQDGRFVLPTAESVRAGASMLDPRTPKDERLTLVYAPGAQSYPIVSYEYAVVSRAQPDPATATALRKFLLWAIDARGGNAPQDLAALNFIPLPDFVRALSIDQIDEIR